MVDGIRYNPFTGKELSIDEIQRLDANRDRIVSSDELMAGMSWLAGGQDVDGEVAIGEDSPLVRAAKRSGMTNSAPDEAGLLNNISILKDEFLEHYFNENTGLSSEERSNIIALVSTATNSFVSLYLSEHPNGPYNMAQIAPTYEQIIEEAITDNSKARAEMSLSVDGYINYIDSNYNSMVETANRALGTDNYIKGTEWNQIKNKAVQYLIGSLLTGNVDDTLLKNINQNYTKNLNYLEALQAINELKNCMDPDRMRELVTIAQEKLAAFLEEAGSEKVVNAIQDTEKVKQGQTVPVESEEETVPVESEEETDTELQRLYNQMIGVTDAAIEDGRITLMEKLKIASRAANFVVQQLLDGVEEIRLLETLNPRYKNTHYFAVLTSYIDQIKSTDDVEQIEVLTNKALGLLRNIFMDSSRNTIVNAVNSTRPIEVTDDIKNEAMKKSYLRRAENKHGAAITSLGGQDSQRLFEIRHSAEGDLRQYAYNMKRELESRLGPAFNSDEIDKYIKSAINDTIDLFVKNTKVYPPCSYSNIGKNLTDSDYAFVFQLADGPYDGKGRYCYNIEALINAFNEKFNDIAKVKHSESLNPSEKSNPSKFTYDRENVIADSLAKEYFNNEVIDCKDTPDNRFDAIKDLKKVLLKLAPAISKSLKEEGCMLSEVEIFNLLQEAVTSTIKEIPDLINKGVYSPIGLDSYNNFSISIRDFADYFMDKVDELLKKAMDQKNEETK